MEIKWQKFTVGLMVSVSFFFLVSGIVSAHKISPEFIEKVTGETIVYDDHHGNQEAVEADPRGENRTYYSFPEWYIVYSAQEYADFVTAGGLPSEYPYFTSIKQMWDSWSYSEQAANEPPDGTTNTVLWTIALSYTVETAMIGLHEKTTGRLSEGSSFRNKTVEDRYVDAQAEAYGAFLNQTPWFYFPYGTSLGGLWKTYGWSSLTPRGLERRVSYTIGYITKAIYAKGIRFLSESTYEGGAGSTTEVEVVAISNVMKTVTATSSKVLGTTDRYQITFPRYRAFKDVAVNFAQNGGEFVSIAGNEVIAFSVVAELPFSCDSLSSQVLYRMPLVTDQTHARYMLQAEVSELATALRQTQVCGLDVEHIYDY